MTKKELLEHLENLRLGSGLDNRQALTEAVKLAEQLPDPPELTEKEKQALHFLFTLGPKKFVNIEGCFKYLEHGQSAIKKLCLYAEVKI